ncbi:MAG: right-handed parallel beta-helix repeat-containing protein [Planctomycetota bacterium]
MSANSPRSAFRFIAGCLRSSADRFRSAAALGSAFALLLVVGLQPATADFTVELHPDNDVRIVNEGGLPGQQLDPELEADNPLANRIAALSIRFPQGSPSVYFLGSDRDIDLIVDGRLPGGASATVTAYHRVLQRTIDSFDVTLGEDAWSIPAEQLQNIDQGRVELQVTLTAPGLRKVEIAQDYLFLPPGLDEDLAETWYEPPTPEEVEEQLKLIADFVPVAGEGFVDYAPAPGAQTYYVAETGSDANTGLSPEDPLRTVREAYKRVGDEDGDTILLKAGDTFGGGIGGFVKSGASPEQPLLISTYGQGDRPIVHTNGNGFLFAPAGAVVSNVVIDGLYILANARADHESGIVWYASGKNITLQDLKVEGGKNNLVFQGPHEASIRNLTVRRCIIVDSWSHHKNGHSSGVYLDNIDTAIIDECTFDHNGWNPDVRGANRTKFNHNVYVQKNCKNIDVFRSIFARGSHNGLQLRSGGIIQDCLFYENALAAFVAQQPSLMEGNVVMRSDDMDAEDPQMFRGDGLEVMPCEHAIVRNNLLLDKIGQAGWAGGIEVEWREDIVDPPSRFFVEIYDNIVVRYPVDNDNRGIKNWAGGRAEVVKRNNIVDRVSGGDDNPSFVDPSRSMATYVSGGFTGFIEAARNRPLGTWDPIFSAASFNQFMREGFTPQ